MPFPTASQHFFVFARNFAKFVHCVVGRCEVAGAEAFPAIGEQSVRQANLTAANNAAERV
jgi:hypothetical protein